MTAEASCMLTMSHKFDDEYGPENFKRISASKSIQLHSEIRKSSSHSHDGQSYKNTSDVPSSNGESSSSRNGKAATSAEASSMESSVGISKASNLKTYTRSPSSNSNFPSLGNKKESLLEKTIPINVDEDNNSAKRLQEERCEDSEDEDDSIPLSAMMKKNNDNAKKETPNVLKKSYEDSDDDDIPLSARLSQNIPLSKVQKGQKYGSNAIIKQERTSTLSSKRLLDKSDSLHSSRKKSKPSDPTESINAKQISVKSESKVEEEEADIPLCQRRNKLGALVDKSSSLKKLTNVTKVNKGAAPSFKEKAKFKKSSNKSEHFNSTKLQPSSDDGEKKWTTLVHNGVIFPPPYKPHGVKILYKGKPVTLTPEQEEVATMFAVVRDTEYMQKEIFKCNFWSDWQKLLGQNHVIQNLEDCDFTPIYDWCQIEKDKKKQMSSADKKALREEKIKQEEKYMWAIVDGVKEK
ncbi:hypothetical protein TSUD_209870, partial [Trifolium subterraneum]